MTTELIIIQTDQTGITIKLISPWTKFIRTIISSTDHYWNLSWYNSPTHICVSHWVDQASIVWSMIKQLNKLKYCSNVHSSTKQATQKHVVVVSYVAADGLAPLGAKTCTDTVMMKFGSRMPGRHIDVKLYGVIKMFEIYSSPFYVGGWGHIAVGLRQLYC